MLQSKLPRNMVKSGCVSTVVDDEGCDVVSWHSGALWLSFSDSVLMRVGCSSREWASRCLLVMKPASQRGQGNGAGEPGCWVNRCTASLAGHRNIAGQSGQDSIAGLECSMLCCRRLEDCENERWHTSQRYGRTPEWMRLWRIRLASDEKVLPQSEH